MLDYIVSSRPGRAPQWGPVKINKQYNNNNNDKAEAAEWSFFPPCLISFHISQCFLYRGRLSFTYHHNLFFSLNLSGEIHGLTSHGVWAVFALVIWCGLSSSPSRPLLIVWCGKAVNAVCLLCKNQGWGTLKCFLLLNVTYCSCQQTEINLMDRGVWSNSFIDTQSCLQTPV